MQTRAARKGGMVAHLMRDESVSACGRVMVLIPGGDGLRLCRSCARISGIGVRELNSTEFEWTEMEREFINTRRDAFSLFMLTDTVQDYENGAENSERRIALYRAAIEANKMAPTIVSSDPGNSFRPGNDGMIDPKNARKAKSVLTDNQKNALLRMDAFLNSLIHECRELEGKEPVELHAAGDDYFDKLTTRKKIDEAFNAFSTTIDRLKKTRDLLRADKRKEEKKAETKASALTHGDICVLDGEFYKVVKSERGFLYTTHWDGEAWDYDSGRGMLKRLTMDHKATAEQAAQFGHMFHRCVFCTRPLSREESEAVGYGPDCAEQRGLPWG